MAKLTRRGLIKQASIGVGATGVLAAAVAAGAHLGSTTAAGAQSVAKTSSSPMIIYVNGNNAVVMQGESQTVMSRTQLARMM